MLCILDFASSRDTNRVWWNWTGKQAGWGRVVWLLACELQSTRPLASFSHMGA